MNILGQCFVILALAGLLFFIDYKVALITSILSLIVYGLVYNIVRKLFTDLEKSDYKKIKTLYFRK